MFKASIGAAINICIWQPGREPNDLEDSATCKAADERDFGQRTKPANTKKRAMKTPKLIS
jgi:hypothetical protein